MKQDETLPFCSSVHTTHPVLVTVYLVPHVMRPFCWRSSLPDIPISMLLRDLSSNVLEQRAVLPYRADVYIREARYSC